MWQQASAFWQTVRSDWPVWLVTASVFFAGLAELMSVLVRRFPEVGALEVIELHHWSRSLALACGFSLIYLSFNLAERKRVAWYLALAVSLSALFAHILRGDVWAGAVAVAIALALVAARSRFTVRSDPGSMRNGLVLMVASLVVAIAYGCVGFWLLDRRDFGIEFGVTDSLLRTVRELTLVGNSDLVPRTGHARLFLESLDLLGTVAGAFALYSLFRPLAYRLRTLPQERSLVKEILREHGRCALDYYKLWPDKSYFFSTTRRSVIAYRAAWGVALSLGDPVGPGEEIVPLLRDFLVACNENGWKAAFLQTLPDLVPLYRSVGLSVLKIGEEAVVDLQHFCASTANKGDFRRLGKKFSQIGCLVEKSTPPHHDSVIDEVERLSNEWLSLPGRRERGFSLGRFDRDYVSSTPLFILRDKDGHALAFVNQVPSYKPGEATIDMMRHGHEVPSGAMDYLFVEVFKMLKDEGYRTFNLGLAALAGVGDKPGAQFEERAVHELFEHLNRFFSYKGLRRYKMKFNPQWEDRYLVYQGGPPGLLKAAIAVARLTEG